VIDKRAKIFRCGKERFIAKGFKETNVAAKTKMAGVAAETFYNYYPLSISCECFMLWHSIRQRFLPLVNDIPW